MQTFKQIVSESALDISLTALFDGLPNLYQITGANLKKEKEFSYGDGEHILNLNL